MSAGRAAVAVLVVLAALTACAAPPDRPAPTDPAGTPRAVATARGPLPGGPVRPPAHGAYLGAYAKPDPVTQPGRILAVDDLQGQLGRRLDIVHTYRKWTDPFDTESDRAFQDNGSVLLYSWAGTDTREITTGRYDTLIAERARQVRAMRRPILLEWRWEMDRPNLRAEMWSPADYVAAWRHLRTVFAAQHVTNASWVWCPTANGFAPGGDAPAFYPGDAYVDWLCVDAYPGRRVRPLTDVLTPFLTWARRHRKPIVIGEYGAPKSYGSPARAAWLRGAAAEFRANPQIRAACYYDSDPDRDRPVERYALRGDPRALAAFTAMARDPYFTPQG
ncbi:MAG TPA: glycosyl hydrolase [Actinocatenispora sp.]